jgi:hypothetical protein
LFEVDFETFDRSPTLGQQVLAEIAGQRVISAELIDTYGGNGPMTPEE